MARLRLGSANLALVAFAVSFAGYALMAAPGVEWMDAGELTAAGWSLGGAHPPGHPAHSLLGKLASFLPVGEIAFRVNLLSALGMAAAVAGVVQLARTLVPDSHPAAVVAALAAAASPLATTNATRAEVYAPVAALVIWATVATVRFARDGDSRYALSAAFGSALAAAFHPLIAAAAALPLALAIAHTGRRRLVRIAPAAIGLGGLALACYLYLPMRANAETTPLLVWDDPATPQRLMRLLGGGAYRDNFALTGLGGRLAGMFALTGEGAGLAALFAGLGGLLFGAITGLRGAAIVLASAVCVLAGAATQQHYNPDMPGYALPALLLLAAGIAPLVAAITRALPVQHVAAPYVVLAPIAALMFAGPIHRADDGDARRTDDALRHWDDTIGLVPAGPALYFANSDHTLFPAQYERLVAGARPDVAIANYELVRDIWFLRHLKRMLPALYVPYVDDGARDAPAERLAATNLRAGHYVGGEVPAFGQLRGSHAAPLGRGWRYALEPIDHTDPSAAPLPPPAYHGGTGQRIAGLTALVRAGWEADRGRLAAAAQAAGLATRFGATQMQALLREPTRPNLYQNLPVISPLFLFAEWQRQALGDDLAWRAGLPTEPLPEAAEPERRLLAAWHQLYDNPTASARELLASFDRDTLLASARTLGGHDRYVAAESTLGLVLERNANDLAAILLLGATAGNQGRLAEAERLFRRATELAPDHAEAYAKLAITLQRLGRAEEAAAAMRQARELAPGGQPDIAAPR